MDYLRAHEEKMLSQMGLDTNHKSMLNPWAGNDSRPSSMVNYKLQITSKYSIAPPTDWTGALNNANYACA